MQEEHLLKLSIFLILVCLLNEPLRFFKGFNEFENSSFDLIYSDVYFSWTVSN